MLCLLKSLWINFAWRNFLVESSSLNCGYPETGLIEGKPLEIIFKEFLQEDFG